MWVDGSANLAGRCESLVLGARVTRACTYSTLAVFWPRPFLHRRPRTAVSEQGILSRENVVG